MIQDEIIDESDTFENNEHSVPVPPWPPHWLPFPSYVLYGMKHASQLHTPLCTLPFVSTHQVSACREPMQVPAMLEHALQVHRLAA